jgi:hypothetical protein
MSRIAKAILPVALLLLALSAAPAVAHEGDPNYRSVVDTIAPPADGLSAQILDHDDELAVVNKSTKSVTILGTDGKPYARLLANGAVQVNARSAMAEGENAPPSDAAPAGGGWVTVDRTGRYAWHDPRINYRTQPVPPQVTDQSKETKVKDWRVPLLVAGAPGAIDGTLTWVGKPGAGSSFPTAAVVSLAVLLLLAGGAVALVRRRRAAAAADAERER